VIGGREGKRKRSEIAVLRGMSIIPSSKYLVFSQWLVRVAPCKITSEEKIEIDTYFGDKPYHVEDLSDQWSWGIFPGYMTNTIMVH
jgi:hypothetical protein